MPAVTEEAVLEALKQVHDPDLGQDIVALGFVKNLKICGGAVGFVIELTTPACPVKEQLKQQAYGAVAGVPGVTAVSVEMSANTRGRRFAPSDVLRGVKNVVAIASGKGGVGKSTATVNLALALAATGARVGILDADIYGPSIPSMLGTNERLHANEQGRAEPVVSHGIKAISVGMLVAPDEAMIWRGPMATHLLMQFLSEVEWGELDYLLLDLPPGTGDVQLTLAQSAPLNGAVIVSTPQDVALRIARKGLRMFQKLNVPIVGILENMAGFVCPKCGTEHHIFRRGGGERTARELGVPFLGSIPLDPRMVLSGDAGQPLFILDPKSTGAKAFEAAARNVAAQISIINSGQSSALRAPREVHLNDREPPQILWGDGTVTTYDARALRLACPCAGCRDEITGAQMINDGDLPKEVKVLEARPVGQYGLNLVFNDQHSTGIYTYELLRELGRVATG